MGPMMDPPEVHRPHDGHPKVHGPWGHCTPQPSSRRPWIGEHYALPVCKMRWLHTRCKIGLSKMGLKRKQISFETLKYNCIL